MTLHWPCYVYGSSTVIGWADATKSLTDLIFDGVQQGLSRVGYRMDDVDSIVLSSHDLIDGRSLSSMVTSPAAGAYFRDEIRVTDDGLVALSLAAARIESGESKLSVVAAWGRASEADYLNTSRAAMDPFQIRPFGMDEFDVSAMRLSRWLSTYPQNSKDRRIALEHRNTLGAAQSRNLGQLTPPHHLSAPLLANEGPVWADVFAFALVGPDPNGPRLAGFGQGTDMPTIGDRDLLKMPALRSATSRALDDAGLKMSDIDLFEIDAATLSDEALSVEAMGLCEPGNGFAHLAKSTTINPSGGAAAGWCYPAMGLVRLAECFAQMDGSAGSSQLPQPVRRAMATGASPIAAQTQTCVILEAI